MRREIEILCLLFLGFLCFFVGFRGPSVIRLALGESGVQAFFYILSAVFFLAIFRPKESP